MATVDEIENTPNVASIQRFMINLILSEDGAREVRSCEIIHGECRNRTSFNKLMSVDDVFVKQIADGVHDCLSRLTQSREILALPTFAIETPDVVFANAQVMSTERGEGTRSVIIRFSFLIGSVTAAFRPELGLSPDLDTAADGLSAAVLAEVALPLLNLCIASELEHLPEAERAQGFLKELAGKSIEIKFQVELIKRFVENSGRRERRPTSMSVDSHKLLV